MDVKRRSPAVPARIFLALSLWGPGIRCRAQVEVAPDAAVPAPVPSAALAGVAGPGLGPSPSIGGGVLSGPTSGGYLDIRTGAPAAVSAPRAALESAAAGSPAHHSDAVRADIASPRAPAPPAARLSARRAYGVAEHPSEAGETARPSAVVGSSGRDSAAVAAEPSGRRASGAEEGSARAAALALVESARQGKADAEDFSRALLERFDGASPEDRAGVIDALEAAVQERPAESPLRRAMRRVAALRRGSQNEGRASELLGRTLRGLVLRDELERIEPRLRDAPLTPERREAVLAATRYRDVRWHHRFDSVVSPGGWAIPDGQTFPDNRIELNVKRGWEREPSPVAHFRALFSHEYTHRLQGEGEFTRRWGPEPPAYATELLRALELVGLEALRRGAMRMVGEGMLTSFDHGREWMRKTPSGPDALMGFHFRGFQAGAAYELAQETGHWQDAWTYHRLVSAGADPREAAERIRAAEYPDQSGASTGRGPATPTSAAAPRG